MVFIFAKELYIGILCNTILQKNGGLMLKEEDLAVSNVKINLTRGKKNPLESVHFFKV
jgi:hypothetical protein